MVRTITQKKDIENVVHVCCAYLRVSTKSQADKGISLETQRKKVVNYCNDPINNCYLDPERIYVDEGRSAYKRHVLRKGYQDAKKDIERNRVDTIVIYSLSRAFRSVSEAVSTLTLLQKCDADIISVTERSINTTDETGRFIYYLFGILAQFESEQIAKRVRDNMLECFEKKGFLGARPPTGYKYIKEWIPTVKNRVTTKVLKAVPPFYKKDDNGERAIVEKVFELYKKGSGQRLIQNETKLTLSVVGWILSSPVYAGFNLWCAKTGEYRIVKGQHESYISREEFNRNVDRRIKRCKGDYSTRVKKNPAFKIKIKDDKPYLYFIKLKKKD